MPVILEREASVSGTRLHWREAGSGAALVLLHGFPFDGRLWQPQLRALPAGWRGVTPDLRGFGGSERGDVPLTVEQHARDVLALMDVLEIPRAVVAGLSMGGYCALALHRLAPARVRALVLADTRADPDGDEARRQRATQADAIRQRGTAEVLEAMASRLLAPTTADARPDVVGALRDMMFATPPATLIAALHGLAARPDARAQLPGIRVPVLVMGGELDVITPPAVLAELAAGVPGAELRLLPDAGHVSNLEAAPAFNDALHAFLARLPAE